VGRGSVRGEGRSRWRLVSKRTGLVNECHKLSVKGVPHQVRIQRQARSRIRWRTPCTKMLTCLHLHSVRFTIPSQLTCPIHLWHFLDSHFRLPRRFSPMPRWFHPIYKTTHEHSVYINTFGSTKVSPRWTLSRPQEDG